MPDEAPVTRAVPGEVRAFMVVSLDGRDARCEANVGRASHGFNVVHATFRAIMAATAGEHAMLRIGFVVSPGFQIMSLTAMSVFEFANIAAGEPVYEVQLLSEHGGPVANSLGFAMQTSPIGGRAFDT